MVSATERPLPAQVPGDNRSGFGFAAVLAVAYGGFVLLSAFTPELLARPILPGGSFNWAFAYGFFVAGLGIVLTCVYVVRANHVEDKAGVIPLAAKQGTAQ